MVGYKSPKDLDTVAIDVDAYRFITSPHAAADDGVPVVAPPHKNPEVLASTFSSIQVKPLLYSSVFLVVLQSVQASWSASQLNLSTFHDTEACDVRPVTPGTCLMFPGHNLASWTWAVNLWCVGAIIGSLGCGTLADRHGRKRAMAVNAAIMILGAMVQAFSPSITIFSLGRLISGIATGGATTLPSGYINEIAPPHLRNKLGGAYAIAIGVGFVLPIVAFFFAATSTGWRYLAAFPSVFGLTFLTGCGTWMVESPPWLLTQGQLDRAEEEVSRLFGDENVPLALSWMDARSSSEDTELEQNGPVVDADFSPWKELFSSTYRQHMLLAIALPLAQQLSGINAVFFYSSTMFTSAGVEDGRIGSLLVNIVNLVPTVFAGTLGARYGNRRMILIGQASMILCAGGYTAVLLADSPTLSVVFTAGYVGSYAVSLGPLIFIVAAAIFPDSLRAQGMSLCLFMNWLGSLVIGVGFPYVADALGNLSFVPFIITLAVSMVYMLHALPETAGRTNEEIQDAFRLRRIARRPQLEEPPHGS